jgi:DTW domain-containing protein YfiP
VEARTEVVLIRHVAERWLTSNTGRLAALALRRSRVIEYGRGEAFDAGALELEGAALLVHTGARSLDFMPRRLIVLDASFRQAARMYKRIDALHGLPELALPPANTRYRLRKPTHPAGMSTLEAIATALAELEGAAVGEPLFELYAELVRRTDALRGRDRNNTAAWGG